MTKEPAAVCTQPRAADRVIVASEVARTDSQLDPVQLFEPPEQSLGPLRKQARIARKGLMKSTAGIDVAKQYLDLAIHPDGTSERFSSDPAGRRELVRRVLAAQPERVVIEGSGGYERQIMRDLDDAGVTVVRVNPRQIRSYARATGRLAKTDRIDAEVLAEYGCVIDPPVRRLPDEQQMALQELMARRNQLSGMRTAEMTRLAQTLDPQVKASIRRSLRRLERELEIIEKHLDERIQQDPDLVERGRVITTEKGVGPVVTRTLLISLPELGHASRQQIAALVGVAPMNRDSGQKRGQRTICGGRAHVRRALFMATLVATRHHPKIRAYYQHLQGNGKCKMVALVACMRKLLLILNAKLRDHLHAKAARALQGA